MILSLCLHTKLFMVDLLLEYLQSWQTFLSKFGSSTLCVASPVSDTLQ